MKEGAPLFKDKILPVLSVLAACVAAFFLYIHLPVDSWLFKPDRVISQEDIAADRTADLTGYPAGSDIVQINTQADLDAMLYQVGYATCMPQKAIKTDVCTLNAWADPYATQKSGKRIVHTGKRKASVIRSSYPLPDEYSPYYVLELEDGSAILAQLPQGTAAAINRGQDVKLPLAQKVSLPPNARKLLAETAKTYPVSLEAALYAFNDDWYQEHRFSLTFLRLGIAFVFLLVLSFLFIMIGQKLGKRAKKA